jgi:type IV secretion system protein VirB9
MTNTVTLLLIAGLTTSAWGARLPAPGRHDSRVTFVTYSREDVTVIPVQRGTVTRIILADDEKITRDGSASGFAADCSKPELEWCIRADAGTSQLLISPKDGATHNNLELKTDQRDYSFAFQVLPDRDTPPGKRAPGTDGTKPMYRVIFRYLAVPRTLSITRPTSAISATPDSAILESRLAAARPLVRNWNYTMQVMKGAEDIAPSLVFDDGRFTYLQFPANREVPTIYYLSPSGEEARVNFHMNENDRELLVVERLGRRFVLRLGGAAVGIWNDAFDNQGVAPRDGTTVEGVARELRQGGRP